MKPVAVKNLKSLSAAVCTLGVLCGVFVMPQLVSAAETQTSAVAALPSPDIKGGSAVDTQIEQNQIVKVKNVWETLKWVGRRPEELKLAEAFASGNIGIDFSGDWYGHEVKGTAYVIKKFKSPEREEVVREIFFTDDIKYYDVVMKDMEKRFGKPYVSAEEPYVESNGGCVQHDYYWTGKGSIHISLAQKHDFYVFRYHLSEKPKEVSSVKTESVERIRLKRNANGFTS